MKIFLPRRCPEAIWEVTRDALEGSSSVGMLTDIILFETRPPVETILTFDVRSYITYYVEMFCFGMRI